MKISLSVARVAMPKAVFVAAAFALASMAMSSSVEASWSVLTHHYDTLRTGWDRHETQLTPSNVGSPQFGLLQQVFLPDGAQVDAQPLFVPGVWINGQTHNVVYIATDNDDVYAIDAATGNILLSANFGSPVPLWQLPGDCNNNGSVGINSTPVIDPATSTMYVMAFTEVNGSTPTWILHALDLATLTDKVWPAQVVQASAALSDGSTYTFNAAVSRQRAALLEANGNIYAGFASFCDMNGATLRGSVLGWQAGSLAPLATARLNNKNAHAPEGIFFTDVWMSGNGIAASRAGRLFFTTGNSDPSGTSYRSVLNPSESVIKLPPDLSTVEGFFTPSDANDGVQILDQNDADFGSGGVLLLPVQPGTSTPLAVAAGKAGLMYLLDRTVLGGYSRNGVNRVLGTYTIGPCWCGESYFTGPDGVGRVVSSGGVISGGPPQGGGGGGGQIIVWTVQTGTSPTLAAESQSQPLPQSGQDGGFFTSVSSNVKQNPIIWAVGRPVGTNNTTVTLYAYDPIAAAGTYGTANWLYQGIAGTWPNISGDANIVPVVADGRVYVASYGELDIFGLGGNAAARPLAAHLSHPPPPPRWPLPAGSHEVYGAIKAMQAGKVTLATRTGTPVQVAVTAAIDADESVDLQVGRTVRVVGRYDRAHVLQAKSIIKAKPSPLAWPADR